MKGKSHPHVSTHKKAMLAALEKSLGVVTSACRSVGIDRSTHYKWMTSDAKYKAAVADIENIAVDFAESQLHKSISKGSDTAVIFFLKTKGKSRGYIERTEQDVHVKGSISPDKWIQENMTPLKPEGE